jgi:uncharacterized protein (TIGR02646 family)
MRTIQKREEPPELQQYRHLPDAGYDGPSFTQVKLSVRKQLLSEQGSLCAYCMQRISAETMKVEHWRSQKHYPEKQLDYTNLLAVCRGNEGHRPANQTCDTRKGDRDLKYNPADPSHRIESRLRYLRNGRIESNEADFDQELKDVLNLNHSRLVQNRKAVYDAIIQVLGRRRGTPAPEPKYSDYAIAGQHPTEPESSLNIVVLLFTS